MRLEPLLDGARPRHKPPHGLREAGEKASWTFQCPNGFAANEAQGHLGVHAGALADRASAQLARWTAGGGERFVLRSVMLGCLILWHPDLYPRLGVEEKFRLLEVGPTIHLESNPTTPKSRVRN